MTPSLWHPFRTPRLSGPEVGWFRPAAAVVLAIFIPAFLAMALVTHGGVVFSGPPKDGTNYTAFDHVAIVTGALAASVFVSWIMAPLALLLLRAAAMLGVAGWGTAILSAMFFGVPFVHVALMGDVTTEENAVLPHIIIGIACLGLFVWAAFWGLMALKRESSPRGTD